MRAFISIHCPSLSLDFGNIGALNAVKPESMHLTLKFLGEIDEETRNKISGDLNFIGKFKKFTISLKGVGAFPNLNHVNVLWVGVDKGKTEVIEIQKRIDEVLEFKFQKERNFTPHLTVARVKAVKDKTELKKFFERHNNYNFNEFTAEKILLMKSVLTPVGPVYSVLEEFTLS